MLGIASRRAWSLTVAAVSLTTSLLLSGCGQPSGADDDLTVSDNASSVGVVAPATSSFLPSTTAAASTTGSPSTSSGSVKSPSLVDLAEKGRTRAKDAQFLIQATFGPTEESLSELSGTTYVKWIRRQMALKMESHRAFFRRRSLAKIAETEPTGAPRDRCSKGSRWTQYAILSKDTAGPGPHTLEVRSSELYIKGEFRTNIDPGFTKNLLRQPNCTNESPDSRGCARISVGWQCPSLYPQFCRQRCWDAGRGEIGEDCSIGWPAMSLSSYQGVLCWAEDAVGGVVAVAPSEENCSSAKYLPNPGIYLSKEGRIADASSLDFVDGMPGVKALAKEASPCPMAGYRFIKLSGSPVSYFMADDRQALVENTLTEPAVEPDAAVCMNVPVTFMNQGGCKIQLSCQPAGAKDDSFFITLDAAARELFFTAARKFVYEVRDLPATEPPCDKSSRWVECSSCSETPLEAAAKTAISSELSSQAGSTRDITVSCSGVPAGAVVAAGGKMFKNTHFNENDVFDFTQWAAEHPGGRQAIAKWAKDDFALSFPRSHDMRRWIESSGGRYISRLGTSGEKVKYTDLPADLQTNGLQLSFGQSRAESFWAACGSPDEVSNDARFGHRFPFFLRQDSSGRYYDELPDHLSPTKYTRSARWDSRGRVWMTHALYAEDQLRQRVAWALSQTFVVSSEGGYPENTELWLTYYDILLRNAFGNFRDLLREVTFSPIMGHYLSFNRNRAYDVSRNFPDENYAREIMQLFTIGLVNLGADGSEQRDAAGQAIPTYSNDDIMEFARVFTGLAPQPQRSNYEENAQYKNPYDPMRMVAAYHDVWPKRNLYGGHLGDGYPTCSDIPKGEFLRSGAVYAHAGPDVGSARVLVLRSSSQLRKFLCNPDPTGRCDYEMIREVPEDIQCDGVECNELAGDVRYVKVGDAHYLYKPPACVNMFFGNGSVSVEFTFEGGIAARLDSRRPQIAFTVAWRTRAPTATDCKPPCTSGAETCICPGVSSLSPVFSSFPGPQQRLDERLKLGAFRPMASPVASRSGISVYHASGREAYDADTVFETGGRFYRNAESIVAIAGAGEANFSFRNPPAFVRGTPSIYQTKASLDEVECLLDHLFEHQNTAPFFAYRLIQRLVSSNPSAAHIKAVANAFKTGSALGVLFSGKYGDIGAAVAATLLHPGARSAATSTDGAFREPVLKLAHFLRSMGYDSGWRAQGEVLQLRNMLARLEQWPMQAPTVFNFFSPSFRPRGFDSRGLPANLVAPEFEIFTTPSAIYFVNSMLQVIRDGELSRCSGLGNTMGACSNGLFYFKVNESSIGSNPEKQLETLDTLLTGGRLSAQSRATVQAAQLQAKPGEQFKAAQSAMILTPEFHTLGAPLEVGARAAAPSPPRRAPKSYRATVMLHLAGGADTWNLLVPMNCPLYEEYKGIRGIAALAPAELLGIQTVGQACQNFGVHNALPDLTALYKAGEAAFVSNIGALAQPTTRYDYNKGNITACRGLFSHLDMINAYSTLKCQVSGSSPGGAGGRMADELARAGYQTYSYAIGQRMLWTQGQEINPAIVSSGGTPRLMDYAKNAPIVQNITSRTYGNVYFEEYTQQLGEAVASSEDFNTVFKAATLSTEAAKMPQGRLSAEFATIAKLIATRAERGAERDIFCVQIGGWDMHSELTESLRSRFGDVNAALKMFVAEMKAQGVWGDVVISTTSDFARTLTSNGRGTDHAWAGNHMILGGNVQGGRVYNSFPKELKKNGEQDIGRGRLVPKYPWENVLVPIASWLGVPDSAMDSVFPNRKNFDAQHIIPQAALFK